MDTLFTWLGNLLPRGTGEILGVAVSAGLTLMVFSYILGDNLLFRIAQHILIGVTAAYAVVIATHNIIIAQLLAPLNENFAERWTLLAPLLLGVLLLGKARSETAGLGNSAIAFMLGVGAALSLNGALLGTILPQFQALSVSLLGNDPELEPLAQLLLIINNLIIVIGTLGVLVSFHYARGSERRSGRIFNAFLNLWGGVGRGFIWIALGVIFAGLVLSRVTLLVSRIQFLLVDFIGRIFRF